MTDLRKAAEKALEWMEVTHHTAMTTYSDEAYEEHCKIERELRQALAQPEQEKESTAQTVDPRLLLGRSNNFTKETENRLCDIERRLAAIETQPALAQPEQEPVAWMLPDYGDVLSASEADGTGIYNIPLYTAPPKREWVGLTHEEIKGIVDCGRGGLVDIKKAEQILKEKNGD